MGVCRVPNTANSEVPSSVSAVKATGSAEAESCRSCQNYATQANVGNQEGE